VSMSGTVLNTGRLVPGLVERVASAPATPSRNVDDGAGRFTDLFAELVNSVNDAQHAAAQTQQAFLAGEPVELHEVMIKAEEAGLTMDLLLEIRNKLMSAYSDIMRMPM